MLLRPIGPPSVGEPPANAWMRAAFSDLRRLAASMVASRSTSITASRLTLSPRSRSHCASGSKTLMRSAFHSDACRLTPRSGKMKRLRMLETANFCSYATTFLRFSRSAKSSHALRT
eukprot:6914084-Prymnesium_polylepis.1